LLARLKCCLQSPDVIKQELVVVVVAAALLLLPVIIWMS
jgi:hypothetical protein